MTREESSAINSIRLICVLAVVMVHSNILHLIEPQYADTMKNCTEVLTMIPALQILFVLSGYLFFLGYGVDKPFTWKDYCTKNKKRIKTLLIPYLLWCTFGVVFGILLTHEFTWSNSPLDILKFYIGDGICGHPAGRAMWYIKSLICFAWLSPLYFYAVKYMKHLTLLLSSVLILNNSIAVDNCLFSPYILLGVYLSYYNFSFERIQKYLSWKAFLIAFLACGVISSFVVSFEYLPLICCFVGIFGLVLKYPINQKLCVSSTFVYFLHLYIAGFIKTRIVTHMPDGVYWYLVDMLLIWGVVLLICLSIYLIMRRLCPPYYQY